jgi:RNA polymerase sigma factor (sigma-70 family)
MQYNTLSDTELLQLCKPKVQMDALGVLFSRYRLLTMGVCMKYLKDEDESKDAVMQVFEKLITDLPKHQIDNFKAWLHTVSKNHCLMQLRKTKTAVAFEQIENVMSVVESLPNMHHDDDKEQQLNSLENAITQLNEHQKVCVQLFYLKKQTYDEVSKNTGYTINEVKSYIQNGKRNLRIMLQQQMSVYLLLFSCQATWHHLQLLNNHWT